MSEPLQCDVVVTGVGVVAPAVGSVEDLLGAPQSVDPVDPAGLVGRKGLRYKDRATQLGYCVAAGTLRDAGLLGPGGALAVDGPTVGVVVSSNFGNLDTVCRAVDTITAETVSGTSPMDLPNASSNIVASSVAIRHGLQGPNLMVCNGATSGIDAVYWGTTLVRSGRVERVLVIGVEPGNDVVRRLTGRDDVFDGGAGLLVESEDAALARGAPVRARIGRYVRAGGVAACVRRLVEQAGTPAVWYVPDGPRPDDAVLSDACRYDLAAMWGPASGALGVLQCAASVAWFDGGGTGSVFATSGDDGDDATSGLVLAGAGVPS